MKKNLELTRAETKSIFWKSTPYPEPPLSPRLAVHGSALWLPLLKACLLASNLWPKGPGLHEVHRRPNHRDVVLVKTITNWVLVLLTLWLSEDYLSDKPVKSAQADLGWEGRETCGARRTSAAGGRKGIFGQGQSMIKGMSVVKYVVIFLGFGNPLPTLSGCQ